LDDDLRARGLTSTVALLEGRSAEQIVCFAGEHAVDLIVLSSHGEGGLTAWALSSTAQKVIARAHTSILIVPAYAAEGVAIGGLRFARILVLLDCSPRAECVFPLAEALARAHDAELILGHVVPKPEMPRRMPVSPEDAALAEKITERNRSESERYLNATRERIGSQGVKVRVQTVISSRRARAIRELAQHEDVDLILLSAHGRTGDVNERHGSVAARLIQESAKPIIVVQDLAGVMRETTLAEQAAKGHPGH
jgi:nucleotide-binding universal stress UspA family protein